MAYWTSRLDDSIVSARRPSILPPKTQGVILRVKISLRKAEALSKRRGRVLGLTIAPKFVVVCRRRHRSFGGVGVIALVFAK